MWSSEDCLKPTLNKLALEEKQYGTVPWLVSPSQREADQRGCGVVQIPLSNSGAEMPLTDALSTRLELGICKNVVSTLHLYQPKF